MFKGSQDGEVPLDWKSMDELFDELLKKSGAAIASDSGAGDEHQNGMESNNDDQEDGDMSNNWARTKRNAVKINENAPLDPFALCSDFVCI